MLTVLMGLLFCEYRFFCIQSQKLIELQEQYNVCASTVRKILRQNQFENLLHRGGQSGSNYAGGSSVFLSADRVVSSSDADPHGAFIVVNRDSKYLQKGMTSFIKKENASLLDSIDMCAWHNYDGQIATPNKLAAKNKTGYGRKRKRNQSASGVKNKSNYGRKRNQRANAVKADKHIATDFMWPIDRNEFWLSSFFGWRKLPNGAWDNHGGIDLAAIKGTPVKAVANGVVIEARYASGYGNTVVLVHNNKYKTRSAHLNTIKVKVGQCINKGSLIGTVGDTGNVRKKGRDASHLHFEVYEFGKRINPLHALPLLT